MKIMGTTNKYNDKSKTSKLKKIRSKGVRLGWITLKKDESVNFTHELLHSEVINFNTVSKPLLVP